MEPTSPMDRVRAIDLARGIRIALVVLGHTPLPAWLNGPLTTFRLPLFFLVSGYAFSWVGSSTATAWGTG
ncbi:acyltransferase family protein [Limnochorda pilosa]|uniref:Acyltransferase n=1 Tax=Limnochorda pilosa TaxID=1555112 RepID=A0A0K2SL50_LIMPI|nr:acyltransferase family protein [Limnochorda pilosa]BAS27722.1 acyltransferase [Limnochorda pilosa]